MEIEIKVVRVGDIAVEIGRGMETETTRSVNPYVAHRVTPGESAQREFLVETFNRTLLALGMDALNEGDLP